MTDQPESLHRRVEAALAESQPRDFTISFSPAGDALWVVFATGAVLELALSPEQMHALGVELVAVAGLLVRSHDGDALPTFPAERTQ